MAELYIGVMSGTSLDGVDISLCEIDSKECKLLYANEYPFPLDLKTDILQMISEASTIEQVGILDSKLGKLFGDLINKFLQEFEINSDNIVAIGLHGQTLWHAPQNQHPFSIQLGSPSQVHSLTSIKVVSDFRNLDITNGGQGAPFAPAFHEFLFSAIKEKTTVVNIGGMANVTLLGSTLQGWDTGPGNIFLDTWIQKTKNFMYDKDGIFAKSGTLHQELLAIFLSDSYFKQKPPKSTGREYFNSKWLEKNLQSFKMLPSEDIQRTLLELTAKTITDALKTTDTTLTILCGGGSKNGYLVQRIQELSSHKVVNSKEYNVDSNAMESMAFAWFAYKRIHNEAANLASVTGAKKNSILGGVYG